MRVNWSAHFKLLNHLQREINNMQQKIFKHSKLYRKISNFCILYLILSFSVFHSPILSCNSTHTHLIGIPYSQRLIHRRTSEDPSIVGVPFQLRYAVGVRGGRGAKRDAALNNY